MAEFEPELLDGVMVLSHPGAIKRASTETGLYFPADSPVKRSDQPKTLKLIPYYAWANARRRRCRSGFPTVTLRPRSLAKPRIPKSLKVLKRYDLSLDLVWCVSESRLGFQFRLSGGLERSSGWRIPFFKGTKSSLQNT